MPKLSDFTKAAVDKIDTATKPVQDFANAAGGTLAKGARALGKFYLRHRERIDTATIAYPVGQKIATSVIARSVTTKLLGVAGATTALGAIPAVLAVTALFYGPSIYRRATEFLKAEDTYNKVKKGDKTAIKDLIDNIAETVAREKPEAVTESDVQSVEDLTEEQKAEIKKLAKAIEAGEEIVPEETDAPATPANDDERDNGAPAP